MSESRGWETSPVRRKDAPGGDLRRPRFFDRARLGPTATVAAVIAFVVLGGLTLDGVIAAPSAGTQPIGGNVTITAASGWVLVSGGSRGTSGQANVPATPAPVPGGSPASTAQGLVLQKGDATLTAQVLSTGFGGSSAEIMTEVRRELGTQVAQISYGDEHHTTISGNDSTSVLFEAIVSGRTGGGNQSGTVDGEVVCMVVSRNAVVVEVAAPQGDLRFVTDDITAMVKTVRTNG